MSELPTAKKSLGQHWLSDVDALQSICDVGEITAEDTVLEIGPGTGTLTGLLVKKAKKVIAVELDSDLATQLPGRVAAANLEVIQQDIMNFDFGNLPTDYKVIANIPYYLTSNLIRTLSETPNRASRVVLLVQREVAVRVAAKPGSMSLLSVSAQFYWEVSLGRVIEAKLFTPPPKIDSQVLVLQRRPKLLFPGTDTKLFFRVVKAGFAARRKTLLNSLAGGLRTEKEHTQKILTEAHIEPTRRPQTLALEEWDTLTQIVSRNHLV